MAKISVDSIKKIREKTGAGVVDVKLALEEASGDGKKAEEILKKKGHDMAVKKKERTTSVGRVFSYVHHTGKTATLVELLCETDFMARTDEFQALGQELAMQITSMAPEGAAELLKQKYIRDPKKTIGDLVSEAVAKTGENIQVGRFSRISLGE